MMSVPEDGGFQIEMSGSDLSLFSPLPFHASA